MTTIACFTIFIRVPRKHTCGHCLRISNQRNGKSRAGGRSLKNQITVDSSDEDEKASDNSTSHTEESEEEEEEENDEADVSVCRLAERLQRRLTFILMRCYERTN